MSLENDIMQPKFRSSLQKAFLNIVFTSNWIMNRQLEFFKPYGLSPQQFNVLRILKGQHPQAVKINSIAERMLDRNSNTSRLVDKLLLKGYVERVVCPNDRRAVNVTITSEGIRVLEEVAPAIIRLEEESYQYISDEEAGEVSRLLD